MFREHVAAGGFVSIGVAAAAYTYALVTDPVWLLILFAITVVGSFLPDVDSDSGMPYYLVFGTATLIGAGIVALYTANSSYASDWRYLVGIPAAALFFLWFVVGGIVKKCTKHRGMFHSIPALLIASIGTYLLALHYGLDTTIALVFGAAMGLGFLSHLVLDELHSDITLDGIPFNVKDSSGTAMKWFSKRRGANVVTYVVLATLLYLAWPAGNALAFYNDSEVIEVENDAPPAPPEENIVFGDGGTGSGAGQGGVIQQSTGGGSQGSSNSGDATGSEASAGASVQFSGSTSGGGTSQEDALLDSLIAEGIISGSGAVSGSLLLDDASVSGSGMIRVDGDAVRRFFRGKFDLQEILLGWRAGNDARLSARGLGYIAASTALTDRGVSAVAFTMDRFDITYRSRGYLFSIIPITFPVRVSVIPQADEGRVSVRLPWYRFFVREFFTPRGLEKDIDGLIVEKFQNMDQASDVNAVLFSAVAEYLRTKIGTVGDTVRAN